MVLNVLYDHVYGKTEAVVMSTFCMGWESRKMLFHTKEPIHHTGFGSLAR
jgi:hypothetical protein